ncbi:ParB N-terminal domain-containing protein [Nocardia takedensis]
MEHVRTLADSAAPFPPIIVRRATRQIIDGWHRLHAARLRGEQTIAAVLFDGDATEAFVLSVKVNAAHGLPLSLTERKAAALRILLSYPESSDRSIAAVAGISHRTVAAIRTRSTGQIVQSTGRVAANGVVHRLDGQQGRRRAIEMFTADPDASARKVAAAAGISLTTAKEVRKLVRTGQPPVSAVEPAPPAVPPAEPAREPAGPGRAAAREADTAAVLQRLRKDPSLRFSETGRNLLRRLEPLVGQGADLNAMIAGIPHHCAPSIAELAQQRSRELLYLADLLNRRG